jgi:hypothetical protein
MKLVKSLLLGSAAGLAAVAGAQAADLPVQKAAPVEYVRVCSAYGVGFFYIPGTDTCLRVSGRARFEYNVASARQFSQSPTGFRSQGRINLDARTQTAYGTLRAFVRYEISRRTGQFHSGTAIRQGNAEAATGVDFFGQAQHQVVLDKAFIQFAGITAGRATSFFDFYANDLGWFGIGGGSDRSSTNLLAYTASFGSGWSATLSLEDPVERRYPVVTNIGGAFPRRRLDAVLRRCGPDPDLQPDHRAADQQRLRRPAAAQRDARHRRGGSSRSALGFGTALRYHPPDLYDRCDDSRRQYLHRRDLHRLPS